MLSLKRLEFPDNLYASSYIYKFPCGYDKLRRLWIDSLVSPWSFDTSYFPVRYISWISTIFLNLLFYILLAFIDAFRIQEIWMLLIDSSI